MVWMYSDILRMSRKERVTTLYKTLQEHKKFQETLNGIKYLGNNLEPFTPRERIESFEEQRKGLEDSLTPLVDDAREDIKALIENAIRIESYPKDYDPYLVALNSLKHMRDISTDIFDHDKLIAKSLRPSISWLCNYYVAAATSQEFKHDDKNILYNNKLVPRPEKKAKTKDHRFYLLETVDILDEIYEIPNKDWKWYEDTGKISVNILGAGQAIWELRSRIPGDKGINVIKMAGEFWFDGIVSDHLGHDRVKDCAYYRSPVSNWLAKLPRREGSSYNFRDEILRKEKG